MLNSLVEFIVKDAEFEFEIQQIYIYFLLFLKINSFKI